MTDTSRLERSDARYYKFVLSIYLAQVSFWFSVLFMFWALAALGDLLAKEPNSFSTAIKDHYAWVIGLGVLVSLGFAAHDIWCPSKKPGETWDDVVRMNWNVAVWGNPVGLILLGPCAVLKRFGKWKWAVSGLLILSIGLAALMVLAFYPGFNSMELRMAVGISVAILLPTGAVITGVGLGHALK